MAQTTPFTIGAEARCTDGACGKVSSVVVDPVARAVTHLVIDRQGVPRLVPLDLIDATTGQIRLGCTLAEFDNLDLAEKTQFLPGSRHDTGYPPDQVLTMPYYGLADRYNLPRQADMHITYDTLPLGEVAVRRGEQVHATDGTIGQVQGLVIDPGSHHVTHLLLQEGHLWGRKQIAIPINAVTAAGEDGVQLSITKQQVQNLPPVGIDHPSG
jgi:sporulation protein YlmC with PRC-barrel domain